MRGACQVAELSGVPWWACAATTQTLGELSYILSGNDSRLIITSAFPCRLDGGGTAPPLRLSLPTLLEGRFVEPDGEEWTYIKVRLTGVEAG
jgi:hypothetical protein